MVGGASLVLAACGSSPRAASSSTSTPPVASAPTTTSTSPRASSQTSSTGPTPYYEVTVGQVKGLGSVLVDGQGFTLYLFVPDRQSGSSTCYGSCAQGWPPLLLPAGVTTPVAGPGVSASLLGTTRRQDGTTEVTYDKWPLYTYVTDSQPGQATGQGVDNLGGLWYVVSPQGRAVTTRR